jgi:hypothetical protein
MESLSEFGLGPPTHRNFPFHTLGISIPVLEVAIVPMSFSTGILKVFNFFKIIFQILDL